MSQIGSFGDIITFSVSQKKVLTFNGMSKNARSRWGTHQIIGHKPRSEFLGSGLDDMTMTVVVSAFNHVHPLKLIKRLEKAVRKGTPAEFVLDGKKVGRNKWVITSMSEAWNYIYAHGELVSATVSLTFQEYV